MSESRALCRGILIASLVHFAVACTAASASDNEVSTLTNQLNACRQNVADDRQTVTDADQFLSLARNGKIILVPGLSNNSDKPTLVPVDPNLLAQAVFLQFAGQKISKEELKAKIKRIGENARSTIERLNAFQSAAVETRDQDENKCGLLAEKLKTARNTQQAQQGPSGSGNSASGETEPLELVLTLDGATVVTDIKKQYQHPGPNDPTVIRHLQSGRVFDGSVEVRNGPLPEGYSITVWHPTGSNILLTTATGGKFTGVTQPKGFGAATGIGAYVCKHFPDSCSAQANISIQWNP